MFKFFFKGNLTDSKKLTTTFITTFSYVQIFLALHWWNHKEQPLLHRNV